MRPAILRCPLVLLIVASLVAGCGSSGSSNVKVSSYVSAVCSAIAPLEHDVETRSSALNNTTAPNAAQAKQTLKGFLTAIENDSNHALTKIRAAGTPDIANGKQVAATITKTFTQLRDAMHGASAKAASLPTDSAASFKSAAQDLGSNVRNSLGHIDASGLTNPEIEKAAAQQPACSTLHG